jgi:LmbE family N-acetylglucosaminyl deacetylase
MTQDMLPRHECSLTIEHNDHKSYYETAKAFIDDHAWWQWRDEESKRLAIKNDDVWTMQWYPDTPVGSITVASHSLESLLDFAKEVSDGN